MQPVEPEVCLREAQARPTRPFTQTAPSSSLNSPNRFAAWARIEAPLKAVKSRSVNSTSTFGGRTRRFPPPFRDRFPRLRKVRLPSESSE